MAEALMTEIIKGGNRTLFLDLRRAKNDAPYVTISAFGRGKDGQDERQTVLVFGEQIGELANSLVKIAKDKRCEYTPAPRAV